MPPAGGRALRPWHLLGKCPLAGGCVTGVEPLGLPRLAPPGTETLWGRSGARAQDQAAAGPHLDVTGPGVTCMPPASPPDPGVCSGGDDSLWREPARWPCPDPYRGPPTRPQPPPIPCTPPGRPWSRGQVAAGSWVREMARLALTRLLEHLLTGIAPSQKYSDLRGSAGCGDGPAYSPPGDAAGLVDGEPRPLTTPRATRPCCVPLLPVWVSRTLGVPLGEAPSPTGRGHVPALRPLYLRFLLGNARPPPRPVVPFLSPHQRPPKVWIRLWPPGAVGAARPSASDPLITKVSGRRPRRGLTRQPDGRWTTLQERGCGHLAPS